MTSLINLAALSIARVATFTPIVEEHSSRRSMPSPQLIASTTANLVHIQQQHSIRNLSFLNLVIKQREREREREKMKGRKKEISTNNLKESLKSQARFLSVLVIGTRMLKITEKSSLPSSGSSSIRLTSKLAMLLMFGSTYVVLYS